MQQQDCLPPGARCTFLLSLWRESRNGAWRAALRSADGEHRQGFANLEQLAAFLLRLQDEPRPLPAPDHALSTRE